MSPSEKKMLFFLILFNVLVVTTFGTLVIEFATLLVESGFYPEDKQLFDFNSEGVPDSSEPTKIKNTKFPYSS
jgi:hypothetical protein